jgi:hypothetical protein
LLHCSIYVASLTSPQIWKKKSWHWLYASSPYCIKPTTLSCRVESVKGHVFKKEKRKKKKRPRMLMSGAGMLMRARSQDRRLSAAVQNLGSGAAPPPPPSPTRVQNLPFPVLLLPRLPFPVLPFPVLPTFPRVRCSLAFPLMIVWLRTSP